MFVRFLQSVSVTRIESIDLSRFARIIGAHY